MRPVPVKGFLFLGYVWCAMENLNDTLVNPIGCLKSVVEATDACEFEGELVIFDSHGKSSLRDKFTKATDYLIEDGEYRPVFYHHGAAWPDWRQWQSADDSQHSEIGG